MKKRLRIAILVLIFMLVIPVCVYAGAVPIEMDITGYINEDGSMTVEEKIRWKSSGKINGIYRNLLYYNEDEPLYSASDIVVESVGVEWYTYLYSDDVLQNGDRGKYNIIDIDGGKQIKIFHPTDNNYIDTTIKYTLKDVVVRYNDVAELMWNFANIGIGEELSYANIKIVLPKSSKYLSVYGHGALKQNESIEYNKIITYKITNLKGSEILETRIVFDNDIVIGGKYQNENGYEKILGEEKKIVRNEKIKNSIKLVLSGIISIISIGIFIYVIYVYKQAKKRCKTIDLNIKYYRELPEDYGVPVMNYLLNKKHLDDRNMLATLMDLVRKKYVSINEITIGNRKKKDYELTLIKDDLSGLNDIEKHFLKRMIFVNCKKITLKELKKKNTINTEARRKASRALRVWQNIIEGQYKKCGLERSSNKFLDKTITMFTFMWLPIILLAGIAAWLDNEFAIMCAGITFLMYPFVYLKYIYKVTRKLKETNKALEHRVKWRAFERYLKDFSNMEEKGYAEIALWEHYMVYAIGLGIADKVLKQIKDIYPDFKDIQGYDTLNIIAISAFTGMFLGIITRTFTYTTPGKIGLSSLADIGR